MTLTTSVSRVDLYGNGAAFVFSFSPVVIFDHTNLSVTLTDSAGNAITLTEGSGPGNYIVSVASYPGTGSITYPASGGTLLPTGSKLTIKRIVPVTQTVSLGNQGGYFPAVQEGEFDYLTAICQQQQEAIGRAVQQDPSDTATIILPPAVQRSNKLFGFDSSGNPAMVTSSSALAALNTGLFNVKDWGVKGDGSTNDTAAINALELTVSATGGVLFFPAGTYMTTGVTKRSNTVWQGAGMGVTVIKLIASTTANAVIAGLNAYTLFGSGSIVSYIQSFSIRDLTVDGNKANGCTSDGVGLYGCSFTMSDFEIQNCNGNGLKTEFGAGGAPAPHINVQGFFRTFQIHNCVKTGFIYAGPNDSAISDGNIYMCLQYNLWCLGNGTGKISHIHCWSDAVGGLGQATVAARFDSPLNMISDCAFEGATSYQCWFRGFAQIMHNCYLFYNQINPTTQIGIRIGDSTGLGGSVVASGQNFISARVDNCKGSAVFFDSTLGRDLVRVVGDCGFSGATGYSGTVGTLSQVRVNVLGTSITNGTLNSEGISLALTGLLTVSGGIAAPGLGAGSGVFSTGAADSGGTGFRLLRVPN